MSERDYRSMLKEIRDFAPKIAAEIEAGAPEKDSERALAQLLEILMYHMCEVVNRREWDHPWIDRFLYQDFVWTTDRGLSATSREEFMNRMKEAAATNPEYHMDARDACASIAKNGSSATVWLTLRVTGLPNIEADQGQVRDIIGKMRWERNEGRWQWCRHDAMRGAAPVEWDFGF